MTDQPPSPSAAARHAAEEVEIVFTDRLHIKQHFHYSDTAHNIAVALDAFAAQDLARVEREAFIRGRDAGKQEAALEAKYGSFTPAIVYFTTPIY